MKQITITEEKKMTVAQRKEAMPYEVLADGFVIGIFSAEPEYPGGKTKCPNCKFEYDLPVKDNTPSFFSVQHP